MDNIQGKRVINGTEGEVWIDGVKCAEVKKFKAVVTFKYEDVAINKHFITDKKLVGGDSDGEITMHKVSSMMTKKLADCFNNRVTPDITIISKLDDKDALGSERIACYHCAFDQVILADWENGKLGEESYKFTFSDFETIDLINS